MDAKRWLLVGIAALIPAAAAVLSDFVLFYAELRAVTVILENHDRSLFIYSIVLILLCGLVFIAAEVIEWAILCKAGIMKKKELHTALLTGAVMYALIMAFLFPGSLHILYAYLPKSESGPGLSLLFFQLSSYTAAVLCGIFHAAGLYRSK